MEGDAGAGRLNPPPMPIARRLRRLSRRPGRKNRQESEVEADQTSTDVAAEDSSESEADETSAEVAAQAEPEVTDEAEPEGDADQLAAEVTAGDSEESEDAAVEGGDTAVERRPSRLGRRGWVAGIAAALVLAAGGIGAGGYLALRYHHDSQAIARNNAAALKAAIECVSATQAPDTNAMVASEQKIIDCGTDAFRAQALLYTSMLVQAYQASNIHVQVADVRAAVERNNKDGSIDVLVAMRVKVASDKSENETGYRLRVTMATAEGQYKIAKLDQVTK
ncbi:Mce protein [Mycobacterium sp. SP-6446]|uniref:Mce protein n=1 Tax=Mycobacterium sp. SP-6446 TaxID=1834162 RepID=UPI00096F1A13|nr:Mce protein [Mycobacterium sp. SP-6446]OMC16085.1 Mce protein [Mycobacterium sp. SP-6446]